MEGPSNPSPSYFHTGSFVRRRLHLALEGTRIFGFQAVLVLARRRRKAPRDWRGGLVRACEHASTLRVHSRSDRCAGAVLATPESGVSKAARGKTLFFFFSAFKGKRPWRPGEKALLSQLPLTQVGPTGAETGEPPIRGMSCNPDPPRLQVNTVLDSWKAGCARQDSLVCLLLSF